MRQTTHPLNELNSWQNTTSHRRTALGQAQKSEALVITRRRHHNQLDIQIEGNRISAGEDFKYLGIQIYRKLSFTKHAKLTTTKANKATQNLSRCMCNVSVAKQGKRTLMSNVVHSILLYRVRLGQVDKMTKKG